MCGMVGTFPCAQAGARDARRRAPAHDTYPHMPHMPHIRAVTPFDAAQDAARHAAHSRAPLFFFFSLFSKEVVVEVGR